MSHPSAVCKRCGITRLVKLERETDLCRDCQLVEADLARREART